jgi:hypothetical protein
MHSHLAQIRSGDRRKAKRGPHGRCYHRRAFSSHNQATKTRINAPERQYVPESISTVSTEDAQEAFEIKTLSALPRGRTERSPQSPGGRRRRIVHCTRTVIVSLATLPDLLLEVVHVCWMFISKNSSGEIVQGLEAHRQSRRTRC